MRRYHLSSTFEEINHILSHFVYAPLKHLIFTQSVDNTCIQTCRRTVNPFSRSTCVNMSRSQFFDAPETHEKKKLHNDGGASGNDDSRPFLKKKGHAGRINACRTFILFYFIIFFFLVDVQNYEHLTQL